VNASDPLARGSVSFRCYAHDELDAPAVVEELRTQAALAVQHGFDGVMTSEHHAGFPGYLPNPLQLAGFLLDAMPRGWAAPCPLLLPLRPVALVAEEAAWLAARFPGRVGLGVAAGALPVDFDVMDVGTDDLTQRFATALEALSKLLRGDGNGVLARDRAVARCAEHPIPLVSAAASITAARRAANTGVGLLFDSLVTPARVRALVDAYRDAGGTAPCILVRRAWVGEPPHALVEHQLDVYRGYAPGGAPAHWGDDEMATGATATAVAARLVDAAERAGVDALNLRVHVPGVGVDQAREQVARIGDGVVPAVRAALAARP
jgi:alkanesulfonate monooxygenase SsuD/methylene tetrahydromethanopterin reductase-like flavin-dependent oxidoreductase (luciferase family)